MEFNIKATVLLIGILCTGLTAGLCFTWSNAITPGIGKLDDLGFLQSFQAMNRAIINPSFLFVFFSPVIWLSVNAFLHRNAAPSTFWSFVLAAALFFFGVSMVTILRNVPLNEVLENTVLESLSDLELRQLRDRFEKPWNRWHMQRAIASLAAFALLVVGILNFK